MNNEQNTSTLPVAWEPNQISKAFEAAFNSGQAENLAALYERHAALIVVAGDTTNRSADGTAIEVQAELSALVGIGGKIQCDCLYAIKQGDIALISAAWVVSSITDASGNKAPDISGRSAEIVRRQEDGRWLYVVDHPTGASL